VSSYQIHHNDIRVGPGKRLGFVPCVRGTTVSDSIHGSHLVGMYRSRESMEEALVLLRKATGKTGRLTFLENMASLICRIGGPSNSFIRRIGRVLYDADLLSDEEAERIRIGHGEPEKAHTSALVWEWALSNEGPKEAFGWFGKSGTREKLLSEHVITTILDRWTLACSQGGPPGSFSTYVPEFLSGNLTLTRDGEVSFKGEEVVQ